MKGRPLLFTGIIAIIAGLVLTLSHTSIKAEGIVVAIGIMFVAVGAINLLFPPVPARLRDGRDSEGRGGGFSRFLSTAANVAALGFGVSLLVFRGIFAPLIGVAFGISLAGCALWQAVVLLGVGRRAGLPVWLWAFPVLLLGAAVFVFLQKTGARPDGGTGGADGDTVVMITTGISLLVLGVASLIEQALLGIAARHAARPTSDVMDVDAREVLPPHK